MKDVRVPMAPRRRNVIDSSNDRVVGMPATVVVLVVIPSQSLVLGCNVGFGFGFGFLLLTRSEFDIFGFKKLTLEYRFLVSFSSHGSGYICSDW